MTNNSINVTASTGKPIKVNVTGSGSQGSVTLSQDTSAYNAEIARQWAISNNKVLNEDYSSKYYANKSKENANVAQGYADASSATLTQINNISNNVLDNIEDLRTETIESVTAITSTSIYSIENKTTEGVANIEAKTSIGVELVEATQTNAVNQLQQATTQNKQEINALANTIKDSAEDIINRVSWSMFDTVLKDHLLTYEESKGLALQGTYVYKDAIAGERYGYPDFYAKCLEEYNEATATETVNGVTVKVHSNGHKFYAIANKTAIDGFFNTMGSAWFYGVDTANECVFLPRNNFFEQMTGNVAEVGDSIQAGLPNITGWAQLTRTDGFAWRVYSSDGALSSHVTGSIATTTDTKGGTGINTLSLNASLSNPIYGNSNTVQPNAVKKLLYICVGNTVADTSWVDVVTQVEGGVKDLEDKTLEGIERLKQSSNALTQTQITNCLLEVPQRIKLELNNGTLTLKAGSEVIVPNGFEVDGTTPKFDYVTIESNLTDTADTQRQPIIWCRKNNGNYLISSPIPLAYCYSGSTAPTSFYAGSMALWYDTNTNLVKYTNNGGTTWDNQGHSLPLAIVTETTTSFTSIDQIFNGFGYIGSTIWVDKGVKGLIPNGRNEDGSLNNIEYTVSSIRTRTYTGANNNASIGILYDNAIIPLVKVGTDVKYNERENRIRVTSNGVTWGGCYAGLVSLDSTGRVTSFTVPQPFRAVDYSDKPAISGWGMPSSRYIDLTVGASGSSYTAPANGYFRVNVQAGSGGAVWYGGVLSGCIASSNLGTGCSIPVTKGTVAVLYYTGTVTAIRFVYTEGEV